MTRVKFSDPGPQYEEALRRKQRRQTSSEDLSYSSRTGTGLNRVVIRTFIREALEDPNISIRDFVKATASAQYIRDDLFQTALEKRNRNVLEFFAKNKLVSDELIAKIPPHRRGGSRPRSIHSSRRTG